MSEPFSGDEDRATDVEPKRVVFKRGSVTASHEELDQALVAAVHLFLTNREADPGTVDDREIVRHGSVEAHKAVVEDPKLVPELPGSDLGPLLWPSDRGEIRLPSGGGVRRRPRPWIGPDGGLGG
jgi:hypothetical protein